MEKTQISQYQSTLQLPFSGTEYPVSSSRNTSWLQYVVGGKPTHNVHLTRDTGADESSMKFQLHLKKIQAMSKACLGMRKESDQWEKKDKKMTWLLGAET